MIYGSAVPLVGSYSRQLLVLLFWLVSASIAGVLIAKQSIDITVTILGLSALLLLGVINPIASAIVMLILAPLRTLIATEALLQLPLDIGQIAFCVLIASWAIHRVARGEKLVDVFWSPISIALLGYIIIVGFTVFSAHAVSAWLYEWVKWIQILILVIFTLNHCKKRLWEWLLFGLILSAAANALVGIYEFFGGSGALHLLINDRFFRAFGTFGQPNPFGGFMGLIAPLALMAALGYGRRTVVQWQRRKVQAFSYVTALLTLFYGVASALILVGVVMSWSRGAWFGLVVALLIIFIALPRTAWRGFALVGAISILGVILWYGNVLPASLTERLASSTQEFFAFQDVSGIDITPENYAVAERLAHWQAALRMATSSPWFGVGLGNYEVVYPEYRLINWLEPLGHAHNYYLNAFAETGFIGLLAYSVLWGIIIALSWHSRWHPDSLARLVVIGLLGSWAYFAVHSLFDNLYVNNLFLHLGLMFGILAILYSQVRASIRLEIS